MKFKKTSKSKSCPVGWCSEDWTHADLFATLNLCPNRSLYWILRSLCIAFYPFNIPWCSMWISLNMHSMNSTLWTILLHHWYLPHIPFILLILFDVPISVSLFIFQKQDQIDKIRREEGLEETYKNCRIGMMIEKDYYASLGWLKKELVEIFSSFKELRTTRSLSINLITISYPRLRLDILL